MELPEQYRNPFFNTAEKRSPRFYGSPFMDRNSLPLQYADTSVDPPSVAENRVKLRDPKYFAVSKTIARRKCVAKKKAF